MATISENLEALKTAKASIKSGMESRGVDLTGVPFTQYGEKFNEIQTKEDLDTELNEQDELLAELESSVEGLPEKPYDRLQWKCDNMQSLNYEFADYSGESLDEIFDGLDTSSVRKMQETFDGCKQLLKIPNMNTKNVVNFTRAFSRLQKVTEISNVNTSSAQDLGNMFYYSGSLITIKNINMINVVSCNYMLSGCTNITNLELKNIKTSLTIGSGTSYGHLLTLDSLLHTIKELWTNTKTSTLTLTMGEVNLEKLANVYVKLIEITDDMRAEDEYIDNKAPFEVCESADEGAMLITEYVTSKKWQLA